MKPNLLIGWNWLLEQAMLAERGSLENPAAFIKRINKLIG